MSKHSELKTIVAQSFAAKRSVALSRDAGMGAVAALKELAEDLGAQFVQVRLSQVATVSGNEYSLSRAYKFLPKFDESKPFILLIDDYDEATEAVKSVMLQHIIMLGQIGREGIAEQYTFVLAGKDMRAALPTPMFNKMDDFALRSEDLGAEFSSLLVEGTALRIAAAQIARKVSQQAFDVAEAKKVKSLPLAMDVGVMTVTVNTLVESVANAEDYKEAIRNRVAEVAKVIKEYDRTFSPAVDLIQAFKNGQRLTNGETDDVLNLITEYHSDLEDLIKITRMLLSDKGVVLAKTETYLKFVDDINVRTHSALIS